MSIYEEGITRLIVSLEGSILAKKEKIYRKGMKVEEIAGAMVNHIYW